MKIEFSIGSSKVETDEKVAENLVISASEYFATKVEITRRDLTWSELKELPFPKGSLFTLHAYIFSPTQIEEIRQKIGNVIDTMDLTEEQIMSFIELLELLKK